jgi:hypothetical protein
MDLKGKSLKPMLKLHSFKWNHGIEGKEKERKGKQTQQPNETALDQARALGHISQCSQIKQRVLANPGL